MKITLTLLISLMALGLINCKGNSVSSAECAPVVQAMMENMSSAVEGVSPEEQEKGKAMLLPVFQKECESGKYDLECLKTAKSIAALQTCKK
jgi:small lipoprotein (TIGR04454 family)